MGPSMPSARPARREVAVPRSLVTKTRQPSRCWMALPAEEGVQGMRLSQATGDSNRLGCALGLWDGERTPLFMATKGNCVKRASGRAVQVRHDKGHASSRRLGRPEVHHQREQQHRGAADGQQGAKEAGQACSAREQAVQQGVSIARCQVHRQLQRGGRQADEHSAGHRSHQLRDGRAGVPECWLGAGRKGRGAGEVKSMPALHCHLNIQAAAGVCLCADKPKQARRARAEKCKWRPAGNVATRLAGSGGGRQRTPKCVAAHPADASASLH